MNHVCVSCKRMRDTWSDSLKEQGYTGCNVLADERSGVNQENVCAKFGTSEVALGWVKIGIMAVNYMVIRKDVAYCPMYEE